eukprot:6175911-Pleurochrysis_carterae.AAC.3
MAETAGRSPAAGSRWERGRERRRSLGMYAMYSRTQHKQGPRKSKAEGVATPKPSLGNSRHACRRAACN